MSRSQWRILIANRGEIALRILRTVRKRGDLALAVYSTADRNAPHLEYADESFHLGPSPASESYLSIDRVIAAGREMAADAVHPGYGFLSENPAFASAVESEGWTFIGPTVEQLEKMGDKGQAIAIADSAGVPIIPSWRPQEDAGEDAWQENADRIGFPLLIKAVAGGGGKGMRRVDRACDLATNVSIAEREAAAAFGDGRLFLERLVEGARHVEVQLVGDGNGSALLLGDRECSLQRRHQKLIEECPAPGLEISLREEIHQAARALAISQRYRGAGTVEFLLAPDGSFYFLEMNTRLQVEHPVTEMVFGVDLVDLQIQVAQGKTDAIVGPEPSASGCAIELRVNAEDPANDFLPAAGGLEAVIWPENRGIRIDSGIVSGSEVSHHYDPLLAKMIAHRPSREEAREALVEAIDATLVAGVPTSLPLCRDLLESHWFCEGKLNTTLVEEHFHDWTPKHPGERWRLALAAIASHIPATAEGKRSWRPAWESLKDWRLGR